MAILRSTRMLSFAAAVIAFAAAAVQTNADSRSELASADTLPERLSDTGLYAPGSRQPAAGLYTFSPQYPLWSDGATKRRWMYLPPGKAIDATDVDAWEFPPGARFWKEFSLGRAVETRFIERTADGSWRYATYVWEEDGHDARLAPAEGIARWPAPDAADGIYPIPSRNDCRACHEGAAVPVLGVSALQLSPDRDPQAPNAESPSPNDIDLFDLLNRGLLINYPTELAGAAPRLPAENPEARAALGYLHANCGHCHNARGPLADVDLVLAQEISRSFAEDRIWQTLLDRVAESRMEGADMRLVAGHPERSQLLARMKSRNPYNQMPPLGTRYADQAAVRLVEQWIQSLPSREGKTS